MSVQTEIYLDTDQPCCIGIDIGTTTVCACVLKLGDGTPLAVYRTANGSDLPPLFSGDHRQDADLLYRRVQHLLDTVIAQYPGLCAIGFTGQMHGVLCTDTLGQALTPLYTWQDERAGQGTPSACDEIWEKTGYRVSAGYGLATVYALMRDGEFPTDTACICTVMDYAAAKLCGVPITRMHTTNAASLGIYDTEKQTFDAEALCKIGICSALLPEVCDTIGIIGKEIVVSNADRMEAACALVQQIMAEDKFMLTVFCGKDADEAEQAQLQEKLTALCPDAEIYFVPGGQDVYPYIFVAE